MSYLAWIGQIAVAITPVWASIGHPEATARDLASPPVVSGTPIGGTTPLRDAASPKHAGESDFISFHGGLYFSSDLSAHFSDPSPPLDEQDLGPVVGHVVSDPQRSYQAKYAQELCYLLWTMPGGIAPYHEDGTPIYAVRGYTTDDRLAAWREGELVLYSLYCREGLEVGADLFDIYGRVARIHMGPDIGGITIDDQATVNELVDLLLAGRVVVDDDDAIARLPRRYQIHMGLDDSSEISAGVVESGYLGWEPFAIELGPRFVGILDKAVAAAQ
jgi:hypothetical protein